MTNSRPRTREAGVIIGEMPTGTHNAITDVAGVKVGHTTLISGAGQLQPGVGPILQARARTPSSRSLYEDVPAHAGHKLAQALPSGCVGP